VKLNTRIKAADGRIGTICYNHLDGVGGVWGEHTFTMPVGGFGDELPEPEFMLREKGHEQRCALECIEDYEVLENAQCHS
jgi:hypothetical protein